MFSLLSLALASLVVASPNPQGGPNDNTKGSGPHPAHWVEDPGLSGFTMYEPITPLPEKVPVILWGNGMCSDQGTGFQNFLREIASHGYIVVANGKASNAMASKASDEKMKQSLAYVDKVAGIGPGPLKNADKTRIGAAGQSCGGWQAYKVSVDKRIGLTGIFDSGGNSAQYIRALHAPVGYFLGGSSDMAFSGGTSDYNSLPASIPALYVNNPKGGHMQDIMTKQGGLAAQAGRSFFDWIFKNSTEGKAMFTSGSSRIKSAGWEVKMKNFK